MQQVGELGGDGVALRVGEQRPRLDQRHLGVVLDRRGVELVDLLDARRRPLLRDRAGEHLAQDHRHLGIVAFQRCEDELQVAGDGLGVGLVFEVVGAEEQRDAGRMQREHVFLEAQQHTAGGVAADAAVGQLHAGEAAAEIVAPALGDGIAEEDERMLVELGAGGPRGTALGPEALEPILAPDRAGPGQPVVGRGDLEAGSGRGPCRLRGHARREQSGGQYEREEREEQGGSHGQYQ